MSAAHSGWLLWHVFYVSKICCVLETGTGGGVHLPFNYTELPIPLISSLLESLCLLHTSCLSTELVLTNLEASTSELLLYIFAHAYMLTGINKGEKKAGESCLQKSLTQVLLESLAKQHKMEISLKHSLAGVCRSSISNFEKLLELNRPL